MPLVIFSHGGLGTVIRNVSPYRDLASHGYVVCSIGHPSHALWTKSEEGHLIFVSPEYVGELQREDARTNKQGSLCVYQKWLEICTAAINLVINIMLVKTAAGAEGMYMLMDVSRIGVMEHSLDGSAALAIPGSVMILMP
ncbi:MAG: hypothetical protein KatS3mg047_0047 [Bellilinea sp.]|nr:MAG: hypothetical protein KatS3mg047_0047 [Bellilinea sp.]